MTKIALIGCTSLKQKYECSAKVMYSKSTYFKLRLEYAQLLKIPYIYILSAKYGLLPLNKKIKPYNLNLKETNKEYQKKWSIKVLSELNQKHNLENDIFYILAGKEYRKYLMKNLKNSINPVPKKCKIGCQLKWYQDEIRRLKRK